MSKPISVGDLVMVVRWPCCGSHLGKVSTVVAIEPSLPGGAFCRRCGRRNAYHSVPLATLANTGIRPFPSWLKRLDPDALKDEVPTKEELTA